MRFFVLGIAAPLALLQLSWAHAQISYNYVEGTLTAHRVDSSSGSEQDAVGGNFEISYEVMPHLTVFGGYQHTEFDDFDLQTNMARAGVGTHYSFSEMRSVFFNVAAITVDADLTDPNLGTTTTEDDGYGLSIGYRESNQTPLEFGLSIDYYALNDADTSETTMDVSLQYELSRRLKIIGALQFGGDDDVLRAGVRYYLPAGNRN